MQIIEENYKRNRELLIADFEQCRAIADFVPIIFAANFGGKAVYCHHKALPSSQKVFLNDEHIKMIHDVLGAWGMASRGMKLPFPKEIERQIKKYDEKEHSITAMTSKYGHRCISTMENNEIEEIVDWMFDNNIKSTIRGKKTKTQIVLLSKTFHHILPNIIPPIDRQYSLRFMTWKRTNFYSKNTEKRLAQIFIEGMRDFFRDTKEGQSLVKNKKLLVEPNPDGNIVGSFNTSLPKIFDNLIVAFVLLQRIRLDRDEANHSSK